MKVAQLKNEIPEAFADALPDGALGDGPEPGLVSHPTSKQIYEACEFAHQKRALVVIVGAAGVGKTTALVRFESEHWQNAYYVNLHTVETPMEMLEKIAGRVCPGVIGSSYRRAPFKDALLDYFHRREGQLLLLDECQSLQEKALDAVRLFLDGGVGLVLAGNEEFFSSIVSKNRRAHFAQLHRRVGMKVCVPRSTEADVDTVLKSFGVSGGPAREYGRHLALTPLTLGGLAAVLQLALEAAVEKKCPLDYQLMRDVMRTLGLDD